MKRYFFTFGLMMILSLGFFPGRTNFASAQQASSSGGTAPAKLPVLLVERDVPQIRIGFDPVINHQALIANLSEETIEVNVDSPIPQGLYVVKTFYPAFGHDSLLGVPTYYPQKVKISDYKILERPSITTRNGQTIFRWTEVSIPPQKAVIAQYDNYSGSLSQFYKKDRIEILDLSIRTSYTASLGDGGRTLDFVLNYELRNKGKEEIEDLLMDVILPDTLHSMEGKPDLKLFEVTEASVSPQANISRGMLGDGFGNPATGTLFVISMTKMKPGETPKLSIKVRGKRLAERGESYPLFTFQFRNKGDRIWPPTVLTGKKELEITKFYYRQCNLVLPDAKLFKLEPGRIKVIPVKGL